MSKTLEEQHGEALVAYWNARTPGERANALQALHRLNHEMIRQETRSFLLMAVGVFGVVTTMLTAGLLLIP